MKFVKNSVFLALVFSLLSLSALAQDTGGLRGKVRNAKDKPLPEVTITLLREGREIKTAQTNGRGEFVLGNLPVGVYNLVFSKNGYSTGTRYNVEVERKKTRDLGSRLVLSVDSGTQVIIVSTVFDAEGRSLPGVKVDVERVSNDGTAKKVDSGYTSDGFERNARGEVMFRFPEETAKYRLTATANGVSASKEISVDSAAIYRLALTLKLENK